MLCNGVYPLCVCRCGDVYEALRDTERALSLCPSHQKSLRRRIKCLKQLGLVEEARQYLDEYSKDHSEDSSFITQCRRDLAADGKWCLLASSVILLLYCSREP